VTAATTRRFRSDSLPALPSRAGRRERGESVTAGETALMAMADATRQKDRTTMATKKKAGGGQFVVVRTYSAGVHVGTIARRGPHTLVLRDARRVWRWSGANTLHEMSLRGVSDASRISEPVAEITLADWIEVIPCTETARTNLSRSRWNG
jgi:hypothetical protein